MKLCSEKAMARLASAGASVMDVVRRSPVVVAWSFAAVMAFCAVGAGIAAHDALAPTPTPKTPAIASIDRVTDHNGELAKKRAQSWTAPAGGAVETMKSIVESSNETEAQSEAQSDTETSDDAARGESAAPTYSTTDFTDTLCVGDGVMKFCEGELAAALPGSTVDALRGRGFDTGGAQTGYDESSGVLDLVRADGGVHARYVVGTGTEEWAGLSPERLEELVAAVDGSPLFIIAPYVSDNVSATTLTNESLRLVAENHGNVHVVAWRDWIAEHRDQLRDNCHPETDEAKAEYAELVKAAIVEEAETHGDS